ncbi:MAG: hypothetical protein A3B13_01740 [Candidatus Liptonbacteria bacterium RIFCSPLOWO2_01_FULL_45_15]|uniref:Uncharacterized protein n=1 Tax=Candidatus Liptonbacteria bacterium RIFCSPLOWO2_01_FULL_45_15 TaxID=1798649 RepID=A0A1G2CGJ1_9BACT|nr:MAG: hypothetical protein A3B13_01740 [Candidatus Liptonbacteria bacterium RIFCSPLOWO2_01_FULL_45_15]
MKLHGLTCASPKASEGYPFRITYSADPRYAEGFGEARAGTLAAKAGHPRAHARGLLRRRIKFFRIVNSL